MAKDLDELDQQLMVAISGLDVDGVKSALKAGADVMHTRKRDGMPVGPMVTPVVLSHRLKDTLAGEKVMGKRVPPAVVKFMRESADAATQSMGSAEAQKRVAEICKLIAAKIGF